MRKYIDKILHFFISAFMVAIFATFLDIHIAAVLAFCVGISKELFDQFQPGNKFDWLDLLADLIGVLIGVLLWQS